MAVVGAAALFGRRLPVLVLLLAAATCFISLARADGGGQFDGWGQGRATFYGDDGIGSISAGSCMFGTIDSSSMTGLDIAALSDNNPDYKGSCGRCYEVACRPAHIRDGYGNDMDRTGSCKGGSTVTVRITDTCPCYYPSNQYSNTRWCCGDVYHMDLSKWAFEKIGNTGDGVMGIYYRQVACPGGASASSTASCNHNDACSSSSASSAAAPPGADDKSSASSSSSSSLDDGGGGSSSASSSASSSGGASSSSSSWSSSSSSSSSASFSSASASSFASGRRRLLRLLSWRLGR